MSKHQIRLAFNSRVNNYEDKIAYIAQLVADKFGDKVDASLPLSRNPNVVKAVYFKEGTSFDDAFKLADEIREFLKSPEVKGKFSVSDISFSTSSLDSQYAKGWRGTFAEIFSFDQR